MTENDKQTEEKIFEAATDVFEERGMDGARMQEIANRAGINKALLHYYFRTKDLLFEAVFQKMASRLFEKFAFVSREDLTLEEKIAFFYSEHITFMQKNPRLPAFILNEINHNPARIKKLIKGLEIHRFWEILQKQHSQELEKYNITRDSLPQIMTSIAAMSVFPFAARGIFETLFEALGTDFNTYIEERKRFAPEFIIGALNSRKLKKQQ